MQDPLIRARGLVKRFGDFEAVRGIDVDVRRGEAFGFLGPNGAGKSSTMRMIGAVSPPSGGELQVFGLDPVTHGSRSGLGSASARKRTPSTRSFECGRTWSYTAGSSGSAERSVAPGRTSCSPFVSLTDWADAKVEALSGGMKRRLTIARALVNSPRLLLLDEPTTGLDPQARHLVWERLFRLKQQGVTLVLTTHYMDEAEQLCDRLVVMDRGKIVAEGSPQTLIDQYSTREVTELRFADDGHADLAGVVTDRVGDLASRVEVLPDRLLLYANDGEAAAAAVSRGGLHPTSVLVRRSSLEDVFLRLTGRSLVD
jgi:lipooligosaccharide transport system ATP-binding protein